MTTIKRFPCSLCGFKFSKEKFMVNHLKFCKEIEDPNDRLGADRVEVDSKACSKRNRKPKKPKRKQSKIGLKKRSKSPESFAFVNCGINLDSELDTKLEETRVASDIFNDFDNVKSEKSSDDFDVHKSNIAIKTEWDIEIGETQVKNEVNEITEGRIFSPSMSKVELNNAHASQSQQLMNYLRTNTAAQSMQYVLHVITPTGRKLYKCSKCNFTNQFLHSVKTHMETQKIHRREKVYRPTSISRKNYTVTKILSINN